MKKILDVRHYLTALAISLILGGLLLATSYFSIINMFNDQKNYERLSVMENFLHYRSQTEGLFNLSENLLKGYVAYIETHPNLTEKEADSYLSQLLKDNSLVRNISTLKDTTILWAYPKKDNEFARGVDVSKILSQKDMLLKTKNTLQSTFQGPISLIQGGFGFILRTPIIVDGSYWGQVSIVIDADKFFEEIFSYSEENNLHIALFNKNEFPFFPFWGSKDILREKPVIMNMELNTASWKATVTPKNGWKNRDTEIFNTLLFSSVFIFIVTFIIYSNIISRFKLKKQVIHDFLTGLYNRTFLEEYHQLCFARSKRSKTMVGILLLDIDNFKHINDNNGHKIGDEVLKLVADKLKSTCRKTEAVFRLGGDEFLILISDIRRPSDLFKIKERIKTAITIDHLFLNKTVNIRSSIGSALYPLNGKTLDEVVHFADQDMYYEKKNSKIKNSQIILDETNICTSENLK